MARLSDRIKELRKSGAMTQEEFGKIFGIVKSTVSLYESGKSTPNDEIKEKICEYFGVSLDYLLGRSDYIITPKETVLDSPIDFSIRNCIGRTGYSYEEVAKMLQIDPHELESYASGTSVPPYSVVYALSEICEVSTDCLLGFRKASRDVDMNDTLPFKYNYQIANRIRQLCEEKNITDHDLERILCLSEDEIFFLVEYGFIPHVNTVISLADYFNVSCDYLLCLIDQQTEKAISSFQLLSEDNKDIIIGDIKKFLREQRQEKEEEVSSSLKEAK